MTHDSKKSFSVPVRRRGVLVGAGALAATVAVGRSALAQQPRTVRFWTTQSAPLQRQAYDAIIAGFEAAHPGVKVAVEILSDNDSWPKIIAAYAGGDVPDLVAHLQAFNVVTLHARGLLEPMDDVVKAVGESDFQENARDIYRDASGYFGACITNNSQVLWYRKDLLAEAGLKPPTYWEEHLTIAKALTKGGNFGASLPYGRVGFSNRFLYALVHQAGGMVIAPDLSVAFNSPQTVAALEYMAEMYQYCPTGSTNYSFGEVLNAFVSGRAATAVYSGRPLINTVTQNPAIADGISCAMYPYRRDGGVPYSLCAFDSLFVPKGARNVADGKEFARWLYRADNYIRFLHATPGHHLPVLKSVAASPAYLADPLLHRYSKEVAIMIESTARAFNEVRPTPKHPFIAKSGEIAGSNILAQVVQRVVVEKSSPRAAAAWGADQLAALMKT